MSRLAALLLWLALIAAPILGPDAREDVWPWVRDLCTGRWGATEPWVVAHFLSMAIWPTWLILLLRERLRARPVPAAPFAFGGFCLGAYALLPWFVLGGVGQPARPSPWAHRATRPLAAGGLAVAVALTGWALRAGDPGAWAEVARTDGFVWTMTADFGAFWLAAVAVSRRRGGRWALTLLPLFGAGLYLLTEPTEPAG
jgi:hypothetical protein